MYDIRSKAKKRRAKSFSRSRKQIVFSAIKKFSAIVKYWTGVLLLQAFLFTYRISRIAYKNIKKYTPIVWAYIVRNTKQGSKLAWQNIKYYTPIILAAIKQSIIATAIFLKEVYLFLRHFDYRGTYYAIKNYDYKEAARSIWQYVRSLTWKDVLYAVKFVVIGIAIMSYRVVTYFVPQILKASWQGGKHAARWSQNNMKTAGSFAFMFMLLLSVTMGNIFSLFAATNTWSQTDWSGGVGTSTSDEYTAASNLDASTALTISETSGWITTGDLRHPYRTPITIDADQVSGSSDHTNFVVLINSTENDWKSTGNGGNVAQTDGGDILFADSSGNQLHHEIESYTASTGELIAWVQIPELAYDSDTTIYMYYGNDEGSLDYSNSEAVWPTDEYLAVYHLNEEVTDNASSGTHYDSTSNSLDGTQDKGDDATGKIGIGQQTSDYGDSVNFDVIGTDFPSEAGDEGTISFWLKREWTSGSKLAFFIGNTGEDRIWFYHPSSTWTFNRIIHGVSSDQVAGVSNSVTPENDWAHMSMTYSATDSEFKVYVDGVQMGSTQTTMDTWSTSLGSGDIALGGFAGADGYGVYDELKIHKSARSQDWLTTEYNNQNNPGTFYSVGSEETPTAPTARTPLTIDSDQVSGSSNLTNFPVLVSATSNNWKSTGNGGTVAQTDGSDILFTTSDGATLLSHDLEYYDASTGEVVAWVKIPTLDYDDDTSIYMYYGGNSWNHANAQNVWAEYKAVYQFGETPSTSSATVLDATSNAYNLKGVHKSTGTWVSGDVVDGKISQALNFDLTYLETTTATPIDDYFTVSAWVNNDVTPPVSGHGVFHQTRDDAPSGFYGYQANLNAATDWRVSSRMTLTNVNGTDVVGDPSGDWKYVTVTLTDSGSAIRLYVDGTSVYSAGSKTYSDYGNLFRVGVWNDTGTTRIMDGQIDHLTIAPDRSDDWVATEYANQNDPSSFVSLGTQEETRITTSISGSWSHPAWPYRSSITIDNSQVSGSSNLTDFPVLINTTNTDWRTTANGGYVAQSDGGDILFTDSSGNKLNHEIESYTASTGELVAWVEVATLDYDDDTELYVYFGNNVGSLDEQNATGVWPTSSYAAVWHLNEGDSTDADFYQDSTANANHGTLTDADGDTIATTGKIGGAVDFAGDADYIEVADDDTLSFGDGSDDDPFSISAWIRMDSENNWHTVSKFDGTDLEYQFRDVSTLFTGYVYDESASAYVGRDYTVNMNTYNNTWVHIVMTYDGSEASSGFDLYINGGVIDNSDYSSGSYTAMENTDTPLYIGGQRPGNLPSNGEIDNIIMYKSDLSSDWIATEYNNQNDPSSFYTVGSLDTGYRVKLQSAAFNTGEASSLLSQISWTESLPTNTDVLFQIRTSADGSTWGDWLGPTGTDDFYTDSSGGETINSTQTDGSGDQYIQYMVFLTTTDASATPTLSDVAIEYVANGAPDFNADYPTASAGGVGASVSTDGTSTVTINYSVRDTDSTSGTATPGYVTPRFEYSLNGGSTWASITALYLGANDTDNLAVDESDYTVGTATWSAEDQVGTSVYVTNAQVRVIVDDNEGGNNTATQASANFILDTTSPTLGSPSMTVDASSDPAAITLSCSDDTSLEEQIGLESDLSDATYAAYTGTDTETVTTPTDIIYGQCRDAYGNETAIQSVTTPQQPINLFYQDISDPGESDYKLFIAWSVVPEPTPGFTNYKIYRSTDGTNYSVHDTITNRSINYLIDDGLSTGTTYYYKLQVNDDDGNVSSYSSVVSDDPDGTGGSDLAAPSISSVSTSDLTASTNTITWTTDELANSTVYYEATASDPGLTPGNYDSSQGVGSFVTSHSVVLDNLSPGTQYYYLVTSTDPSSNQGVATSSGTFTTNSGPVITNTSIPTVYNEEATVTWTTDIVADSTVYYSTNSDMSGASQLGSSDDVTEHSVTLTGLTSGTKYYVYVESQDTGGNTSVDKNIVEGETRYYSFTTTSDSTAPVITDISAALVGETGATVAWTTDEGATSQVEWGLTTALGTTTTETSVYTTQHAVTLTGLSNTTTYYFKVTSKDRALNTTTDNNSGTMYSFTTLTPSTITVTETVSNTNFVSTGSDSTPPDLSNITVTPISSSVARVTFDTDEVANGIVEYGTTSSYGQTAGETDVYHFDHEILLTGLSQGTTYQYRIISEDVEGNETTSDNRSFTMSAAVETDDFALTDEVRLLLDELSNTDNLASASELAQEAFGALAEAGVDVSLGGGSGNTFVGEGGLTIVNPQITNIGSNSVQLGWTTSQPAKTVVEVVNLQTNETRRYDDLSFLRNHDMELGGLLAQVSYTARITVEDEEGNIAVSSLIPFSTVVNNDPLSIEDVRTSSTLIPGRGGKVQTIVSWKTNKPATSQVFFDDDMSSTELRFSTDRNQSFVMEHVVIISNFEPGTIYRVRAESTDSNIVAISPDYSLLTPRSRENIVDVIIENVEETFGVLGR